MNEVFFTYLLMYGQNSKVCGLMNGLLRIYGVIGIHMVLALVDKDWDHQHGFIMWYMKRSDNMYDEKWCLT